ncbi:MAG: ADOP family duplicated permease [Vicinamibacterales bacterium]|jgi:predicted permease
MRTSLSRLLDLVLRRQREERLTEELQSHLDMLTDEHVANGLSPAEARLAARKSFGGVDQTKMRYREQRGFPIVETVLQDVRFAIRVLTRDRGFALTAILVLGVGLGVNNMFFTLVYAHKFRGVDIKDVEQVMHISTFDDRGTNRLMSLPEFHDLQAAATSFDGLAAYVNGIATVGDEGRAPDRFSAAYVSSNAFPLLNLSPSLGRLPSADDDRPGGEPVVLLGSDAWRQRYNGDPQVLGRTVLINGSPAMVIGIIPERSGFPSAASIWLPLGQFPELKSDRSAKPLNVVGRLQDGAGEEAARSEVETIFGGFEAAHPDTNRNVRARVVPLNQRLLGSLDGWMPFIWAGIIVILVACANAANLMMARAVHRAPEIAIRTSLGASRTRIVGQLLIEAVVIASAAAMVGAVISVVGVRAVQSGIPEGTLPYWNDYAMDRAVFGGLVALSLATVAVFGLIPAIYASGTDVSCTLKDGGRAKTRGGMGVVTGGFLSVELALAMILLAQVALASYIANQPMPTDANINTTEIVTAAVTLPTASYATAQQRSDYFVRLEERLQSRAEVVSVSRATVLPGGGTSPQRLQIRGQKPPQGEPLPTVLTIDTSPRYFETLALDMLKGRDFTLVDGGPNSAVAIVNDRFAQVFLDGADAIGLQLALTAANAPANTEPRWVTVIGVAPTVRQQGPGGVEQRTPVVYVPIAAAAPATSAVLIRHRVDAERAAGVLRAEAQATDPNVAFYSMRTMERAVREAQWNRHMSAVLADTVTWMSVLLAMVGLYAVTAQRVTLKTREIGLRMALGARSAQVAETIVAGLRVPLLAGLLLGTAGAMAWDGAYSSGIAGVYASAPPTLLKIAGFIVALMVVSCFIPLRRAMRMSPVSALRDD